MTTKLTIENDASFILYLVYMRAICEYACAVLENCGLGIYNKLDPLQVGAARIVTGLPIFASDLNCFIIKACLTC
jgi:hypothetical protein